MAAVQEEALVFEQAMSSTKDMSIEAALAFDYSPCRLVVDVGGCQGTLIANILQAHPNSRE
jgi:hypothetical protein